MTGIVAYTRARGARRFPASSDADRPARAALGGAAAAGRTMMRSPAPFLFSGLGELGRRSSSDERDDDDARASSMKCARSTPSECWTTSAFAIAIGQPAIWSSTPTGPDGHADTATPSQAGPRPHPAVRLLCTVERSPTPPNELPI